MGINEIIIMIFDVPIKLLNFKFKNYGNGVLMGK